MTQRIRAVLAVAATGAVTVAVTATVAGGYALRDAGLFRPSVPTALHVSASRCSDAGTSRSGVPFCTINAAAHAALPGQQIVVDPGTYPDQPAVTRSGTPAQPLVIRAAVVGRSLLTAAPSAVVGGTQSTPLVIANVSNQDYTGFTVSGTGALGDGVVISNSTNVVFENSTVTGSGTAANRGTGVALSDDTATVVREVHSDFNTGPGFSVTGSHAPNALGVTLENDEASHNGIFLADGTQRIAQGMDVRAADTVLLDNVLHDNEDSGAQFYPGADRGLAADNLSYHNGDHGIDDLNVTGGRLIGNTVYANCTDGLHVEGTSSDYTVEDNISVDNAIRTDCPHGPAGHDGSGREGDIGLYDSATTGSVVDFNIVYLTAGAGRLYNWGLTGYTSLATFQAGTGQGARDLQADPRWVNPAGSDFHLQGGSPAIDSADSGVAGEPSADLEGNGRVDDPATPNTGIGPRTYDDRGAYEFQATVTQSTPLPPSAVLALPTTVQVNTPVTADASQSVKGLTAASKPIGSYTFDFGDGTVIGPQSGATATHAYSAAGTHTVKVTVADTSTPTPLTSTASQPITVTSALPPTARLTVTPTGGPAPLTVSVDGSASAPGTGASAITGYTFDFGDGSNPVTQSAPKATYTYAKPGTYSVVLSVVETGGQTAGSLPVPVTVSAPGQPGSGPVVARIAGADRYGTGVALSQQRWAAGQAEAVVLATGQNFPDALAGGLLAVADHGPLLLTDPNTLTPVVRAEIIRVLRPGGTVYLLGGTGAIGLAIQTEVADLGYPVQRFGGVDRFDTARIIATRGLGSPAHAIVATGLGYADALSAGPYAAGPFAVGAVPAAILLSNGPALDNATRSYLVGKTIDTVGGPAAQAVAAAGIKADAAFSGADRYDTARLVSGTFTLATEVGVATGASYPDALTGGAYAASLGIPLLLTDPTTLSAPTLDRLVGLKAQLTEITVFGGPTAIAASVLAAIAASVG